MQCHCGAARDAAYHLHVSPFDYTVSPERTLEKSAGQKIQLNRGRVLPAGDWIRAADLRVRSRPSKCAPPACACLPPTLACIRPVVASRLKISSCSAPTSACGPTPSGNSRRRPAINRQRSHAIGRCPRAAGLRLHAPDTRPRSSRQRSRSAAGVDIASDLDRVPDVPNRMPVDLDHMRTADDRVQLDHIRVR